MFKGGPPPGRILVVDDQPGNLRVVGALLARSQHEVLTASNGADALRLAAEQPPDLVLLDLLMPDMDGFQVLAEMKRDEAMARLPVVCLTAARDREQLLRAFDAGAVDYVTKPFLPEELLARVNAHLGLKLARDRLERVARERQQLVNLVAHDLKNPLSSVLFAVDILRSDGVPAPRVPRYLETIHDSARDAIGYIRMYLETQRAARRETAAAIAVVADVLVVLEYRYGLQFEARGRQLRVQAQPGIRAAIDPVVLRQVVENLVSNALKYAPDSDLEITARAGAPGYVQLVAEDRGPGIAPARQRELFQPFTRLHADSPGTDGSSSGLGLSLARQIIAEAGGQLWYEDREGGGARFIIE